jgi:hypothetical protein
MSSARIIAGLSHTRMTARRGANVPARNPAIPGVIVHRAARARVEWRPSLALLDEVIGEFCR